jgi:hypothetical protein
MYAQGDLLIERVEEIEPSVECTLSEWCASRALATDFLPKSWRLSFS